MKKVSVHDVERDFAGVMKRVEAGERLLIVRDDRPIAELQPASGNGAQPRPCGLAAGEFEVPDDFDAPLPDDVMRGFEGR